MKSNFLLLNILHFLNDGIRTSFVVLLPFIAADLHLSLTTVGYLGSSQGILMTALAIPAGLLAARVGGMRVLTTALALYSLATIAMYFAGQTISIVLIYFLAAIGFGLFHPVAFTLIARNANPKQIGSEMGKFQAFGDIGRTSIPPLAIALAAALGWKYTIVILGIVGVILYIFQLLLQKKDTDETVHEVEHHGAWLNTFVALCKDVRVILATISNMIDAGASNITLVFFPFVLLAKGITALQLSFIMAAFFVGGLSGKIALGKIADSTRATSVFVGAEVCMALLLFLVVISNNLFVIVLVSILLGIFTKGTSSVANLLVSQGARKAAHYDKVYALSEVLVGIAVALVPILGGIVADKFGVVSTLYLSAGMALLTIVPVTLFWKIQNNN